MQHAHGSGSFESLRRPERQSELAFIRLVVGQVTGSMGVYTPALAPMRRLFRKAIDAAETMTGEPVTVVRAASSTVESADTLARRFRQVSDPRLRPTWEAADRENRRRRNGRR